MKDSNENWFSPADTTSESDAFWMNLDWGDLEKEKKHKRKRKKKKKAKKKATKRLKKTFQYRMIEKSVDAFLYTASDIARMYAKSKFHFS